MLKPEEEDPVVRLFRQEDGAKLAVSERRLGVAERTIERLEAENSRLQIVLQANSRVFAELERSDSELQAIVDRVFAELERSELQAIVEAVSQRAAEAVDEEGSG